MNLKTFYDKIRTTIPLTSTNVSGFDFIISEGANRKVPLPFLAYVLATVYHETAATMQPIREYGKGKGRKYGVPVGPYKKVYYGRGYVQLTWEDNYIKASKKLGVDFHKNPDLVMEPEYAVAILFEGMTDGWFTGKDLDDYIDLIDESDDEDLQEFINARRIVNGTDKAKLIGGYALVFEKALRASGYDSEGKVVIPDVPEVSEPDDEKESIWIRLLRLILKAFMK